MNPFRYMADTLQLVEDSLREQFGHPENFDRPSDPEMRNDSRTEPEEDPEVGDESSGPLADR